MLERIRSGLGSVRSHQMIRMSVRPLMALVTGFRCEGYLLGRIFPLWTVESPRVSGALMCRAVDYEIVRAD